jgi:peptide/nickel transport system ATP-binding protein
MSIIGPKVWLIVAVIAVSHLPRVARVIREATRKVIEQDYVKAAEAIGLPRWRILSAGYGRTRVLEDIDVSVSRGECVALLGESGSGKTTLSRSIAGLHRQFSGELLFDGAPLAAGRYRRTAEQRRRVQYVFQNPYEALNPRRRVRDQILGPYAHLVGRPGDPDAVVAEALERTALSAS